jgi:hypothetical protein
MIFLAQNTVREVAYELNQAVLGCYSLTSSI